MDKSKLLEELTQFCDLREEIKDLRNRIDKNQQRLEKIEKEGVVSDTVTGTRRDGTIGPIKITGFPIPEHGEVRDMLKKRNAKLHILEEELQEAMIRVSDYIDQIPKSELRQMFRLYYEDNLMWYQVAMEMNRRFPKRERKYTADSCRKKHDRYLEKNEEISKTSAHVR